MSDSVLVGEWEDNLVMIMRSADPTPTYSRLCHLIGYVM